MGEPNACRLIIFLAVTSIAAGFLGNDDQTLRAFAWVFLGIGSLVSLREAWKMSGECECVKECMKSDEFGKSNDPGFGPRTDPGFGPRTLQPRFNIENI